MNSSPKKDNRNILIVDDESDVLDFLKIYLESLSWNVFIAETTGDAFGFLEQYPVFLIITDIAMPTMDGYEFITAVQDLGYPSQVALMTGFGYNPNHTLVKLNRTYRYPCLFKPFNRRKVAETAQSAFEAYHTNIQPPQ